MISPRSLQTLTPIPRYMKIETFVMLTMAFIINIFAIVLSANFSDIADPDSINLESAGSLIGETFGNLVWGEGKRTLQCAGLGR